MIPEMLSVVEPTELPATPLIREVRKKKPNLFWILTCIKYPYGASLLWSPNSDFTPRDSIRRPSNTTTSLGRLYRVFSTNSWLHLPHLYSCIWFQSFQLLRSSINYFTAIQQTTYELNWKFWKRIDGGRRDSIWLKACCFAEQSGASVLDPKRQRTWS